MKKVLSCLVALVLMMSMMCISPISASAETNGDYEYAVLDDGTLQITKYNGTSTDVTIPTELDGKAVTSIGADAFGENKKITNLVIPEGITTICERAFWFCSNLKTLSLPNTLTEIKANGFAFCESLEEIVVPDSVSVLGDSAFQDCSSAKSIKLPSNLETISSFMISGCKIEELNIPSSVKTIEPNAVAHCYGLTSIIIPEGVTTIGSGVFSYCSGVTSVSIPSTVETIEMFAFSNCTSLMEVTVPDTVKEIGRMALGYWFDKSVWNDIPLSGFVLKGYAGSAADSYAKEYNVKFESLGDSQITPPTTAKPTEPTTPPEPGTVNTIYYKNSSGFSTVYAYCWNNETKDNIETWPGTEMTKVSDDVFKFDVPVEYDMIIFSNKGANQTSDLSIPGNNMIYENGSWSPYSVAPSEPVTEPSEPTSEPVTEPSEPTSEPVTEPSEPTSEPVTEPSEPTSEPVTEPSESTSEPATTEPTTPSEPDPTKPTEPSTTEPTPSEPELVGDVNGDGLVNIDDVTYLQMHLAGYTTSDSAPLIDVEDSAEFEIADYDKNGVIDINDATAIQRFLVGF